VRKGGGDMRIKMEMEINRTVKRKKVFLSFFSFGLPPRREISVLILLLVYAFLL
jgi:hypothetical protein